MKTLIAVPCMDEVAMPFTMSLAMLNKTGDCVISMVANSLIYDARNRIAGQAMDIGADYVMWFDSDVTFPPDTILKMLKHMEEGKDIVSGLYFRRKYPYTPVIFKSLEWDGVPKSEGYEDYPRDSVFEVAGCGFGCVMTKVEPFFDIVNDGEPLFTPMPGTGEDLSFCIRARQRGYKIWCDSTIKCGHVGRLLVNENFYDKFGKSNK